MAQRRVLVLGVLFGAMLGLLWRTPDLLLLDALQGAVTPAEPAVAIVAIDATATEAYGWPIDPALYAASVMQLGDADATAIAMDIIFADGRWQGEAGDGDVLFAEVGKGSGLVLGTGVYRAERPELPSTPGAVTCETTVPDAWAMPLRTGLRDVPVGHVHARPDPVDGVFRRIEGCVPVHDGCVRDLGSAVLGETRCEDRLIPAPRALADYPTLPFTEVLTSDAEALRAVVGDRVVLFALTDPSLGDWGRTPRAAHEPLAAVHANRIQSLIDGRAIGEWPRWLSALLGGLLVLAATRLPGRLGVWIGLTAGAPLLAVGVSTAAFLGAGQWMPAMPLALTLLGGTLAEVARLGEIEAERHRRLERAFGSYVSPDVLQWIHSNPTALEPDNAERRELAVLFSDIAGYTALSNQLETEAVMASLRLYLGAMIRVIQAHGGYLDKINGDGLMVLFGAPRPSGDPSVAAVACAREMQAEVQRLSAEWTALTGGTLVVRVGIATGSVFVGNLGSAEHIEYTAIGPTVNLAARLESAAPKGGVLVCGATYAAVGEPPAEPVEVELKGFGAMTARALDMGSGTGHTG